MYQSKEHLEIQQIKLAYQKKCKKIKTIKVKPKTRDILAEAEYKITHERIRAGKVNETEGKQDAG